MSILDPRIWLAMLLAVFLAYGGGRLEQSRADTKKYQSERTAAALDAARVQIKAVDEARTEEQRRTAAQMEIANAAAKDAESARADARTAGDAADRLRVRVADLLAAARAAKDTGVTSAGPAAGDPDVLLAELLNRAVRRATDLAAYADSARIAGLACERSYDALTPKATVAP